MQRFLLRLSLLRFVDSAIPGNSFGHDNSAPQQLWFCLSQTIRIQNLSTEIGRTLAQIPAPQDVYVYIYIYIYMADSPDQWQLNTQQRTQFTNEMKKAYPTNRKSIGVPWNMYTPHYWVCLLGALRGMLRGYASGSVEGWMPLTHKVYNCIDAVKHTQSMPKAYPKA